MMKKASVQTAVVDICRREVGRLSTRKFAHRLAASEDLVLRFDLARKLQKHIGCVNTVSFNAHGDILVSGSDDRRVVLWDWETGRIKLNFNSGHNNNIFQAKIMPETDDRSIVTCAADGQPRRSFVAVGSDELTRLFDIRRYRHDASAAFGNPVDHFCPKHLLGDENVGITGVAFSDQSELLVSYNEEFIYLFSKDMGWGSYINSVLDDHHVTVDSDSEMETDSKPGPRVFKGHRNCLTVKGVGFFGANEYVASGSDCGRMFIWKKKDAKLVRVMEADKQVVNCIQPRPHTLTLASCGLEWDIKIWTPTALEKAPLPTNINRLRPSANLWMVSTRDMAVEVLRSQGISQDRMPNEDSDMMELIVTFDPNSSDTEDEAPVTGYFH